jgi:site-specific DNA-methyltransferase (adenine-specific)
VAIEDAGFEMRDSIAWLYGSGFPKSMDVSKAIDKAAGAEREILGRNPNSREQAGKENTLYESGTVGKTAYETAPATPEAQKWEGWGTALKPAFEPVVVARKPLGEKTIAANVLAYGTGGLNIDASRIGTETIISRGGRTGAVTGDEREGAALGMYGAHAPLNTEHTGRWPANIILDPYTAELLDEQSGQVGGGNGLPITAGDFGKNGRYGIAKGATTQSYADKGGASRFFYVAKASKKDRNEGLEELEGQEIGAKGNGLARTCATCSASVLDGCDCPDRTFVNPTRQNFHPTVKPTSLMEYLIKLVTPEGGTVLDPFTGSGSTGKAALLNGYQFIGIELTDEYLPIIEGRLKWANEEASKKEEEKNEVLF